MTKTNILRKGVAIAIGLAVTTFGAQAQLGGMLKKAADSAKKEVTKAAEKKAEKVAESAVSKATEKATEKVTEVTESVVQSVVPNPERDAEYKKIFDAIESAKKETEYDKKLDSYCVALNVRRGNIGKKLFSCADSEMAKIDAEMKALEAKLWEIYNGLKAANKTPKYEPFEYIGCGQVLAEKEMIEKEKEKGLGFWSSPDIMPMPTQTYTLSSDVVKKIEEIYPRAPFYQDVEKAGGKVVKYIYTSNEWKDISYRENEWPYADRKYRVIVFSILVKMPDEDFYRLYDNNASFRQYYDSAGKLTDKITVSGGGGYYTRRQM